MPRRAALFTAADLTRALRAAAAAGAGTVEVTPIGSILIHLRPETDAPRNSATRGSDDGREIVL